MKLKTAIFILLATLFAGLLPETFKVIAGTTMEAIGAMAGKTPQDAPPWPWRLGVSWLGWPWHPAWWATIGAVSLYGVLWLLHRMKNALFDLMVKDAEISQRTCLVTGLSEYPLLSHGEESRPREKDEAAKSKHWEIILSCVKAFAATEKALQELNKERPDHILFQEIAGEELGKWLHRNGLIPGGACEKHLVGVNSSEDLETAFRRQVKSFITDMKFQESDPVPDALGSSGASWEFLRGFLNDLSHAVENRDGQAIATYINSLSPPQRSPAGERRLAQTMPPSRKDFFGSFVAAVHGGKENHAPLRAYVGAVALDTLKWGQTLRAIAHMTKLKRLVIIPSTSRDGKGGSHRQVKEFLRLLEETFGPEKFQSTPQAAAIPPKATVIVDIHSAVDYEQVAAIEQRIKKVLRDLKAQKVPDHDIVVDITAGQKSFSVAAAIHTLQHAYAISYVSNKGRTIAHDCKIALVSDE